MEEELPVIDCLRSMMLEEAAEGGLSSPDCCWGEREMGMMVRTVGEGANSPTTNSTPPFTADSSARIPAGSRTPLVCVSAMAAMIRASDWSVRTHRRFPCTIRVLSPALAKGVAPVSSSQASTPKAHASTAML